MKKLSAYFQKIGSVALALLILCTTVGATIEKHCCENCSAKQMIAICASHCEDAITGISESVVYHNELHARKIAHTHHHLHHCTLVHIVLKSNAVTAEQLSLATPFIFHQTDLIAAALTEPCSEIYSYRKYNYTNALGGRQLLSRYNTLLI